jgi:secondary thiamine-phosphate synthase enzyme
MLGIMWHQQTLSVRTRGRGTLDIGDDVARVVADSDMSVGLAHLFLAHTSASLILCENADPTVRQDLEAFLARSAPDGDPRYRHDMEGPDDMAAHLRTILTGNSLTVPIAQGRLALGTWQGIYLYEHRTAGHRRSLVVTVQGEGRRKG